MPTQSVLRAALAAGVAVACLAGCASHVRPAATSRSAAAGVSAGPSPTATATASPTPARSPSPAPTPVVQSASGVLAVVSDTGPASGPGTPTAYVVEVESGLGIDPQAFARDVDRVLTDPRSWGAGGRRAVHRVAGGEPAFRVSLVSPTTADRLCAPLQTNGYFSCGNRGRAVLNVARWLTGADAYAGDLASYRQYLVNHEVGHLLGRGHEPCPGPGSRAPVMLQQSKGLDGCTANSWPYP